MMSYLKSAAKTLGGRWNAMDGGEKKMKAKDWDAFANSSSVHGIRFTSPGFSRTRRLAWGVLIICGFGILFGSMTSAVVKYLQYEVNTIVTMVSEREANFPAVTLCNMNALRRSKFTASGSQNARYLHLAKLLTMTDLQGTAGNVTLPDISGKHVKDMYRYFGHTLDQFEDGGMLLNCSYRGIKCDKASFKPVITDLGQCYTFNPGGEFGRKLYGKEMLTSTQPGNGFGLSMRLLAQADEYVLMPTQDFSTGWKMFIHDQKELPLADDYGFALSPGTHTHVGMVKRKVINLKPPYKTACRDAPLETGDAYSLKGCLRICQDQYIVKRCGCQIPINFLNGNDSALCDLKTTVLCALPAQATFRKYGNHCICPEPCESVEYTPSLSYSYFPSDIYAVEVARHLVKIGAATSTQSAMIYMRKNIMELDIYFQQMNHMVVRQIPAKTLQDIYSELGGLLGASLGASFLTFIELFDYIFTRIAIRLEGRKSRIIDVKSFDDKDLASK